MGDGDQKSSDPELLISVDAQSAVNAQSGLCCAFEAGGTLDAEMPENAEAQLLTLPRIDPDAPWTVHGVIDAYGDMFGEEDLAKLLSVVSSGGGGLGYTIERADFAFSSYEVDNAKKIIFIDVDEVFSTRTNREAADNLREAIFREFENGKTFWDHAFRVAKGAGITVLGAGEIFVGVTGIIVPVPGTTAVGLVVTAFGASTVVEGVTQMFNVNEGQGVNPLEEGFAAVGSWAGEADGEQLARGAFAITNLVVSVGGSYKLLKLPGKKFLMRGNQRADGRFFPGGITIGRMQLGYPLERVGGHVLINVTNNSGQWIFRFQQIQGQVVLNGRIVNVQNWHRVASVRDMLKVLCKLALHGAKEGL